MSPSAPGTSTTARRAPGGPPKGDRRRRAILDAVERLLTEKTIAQLSVEDIAAAAGISRSGFYFYFESKYAALGDALGDVGDEMSRAAEDFFAGTDEPPEVYVPRALSRVKDLWRRHADLMVAIVDAAHSDSGARALWDAWVLQFVESIAERIEFERAAGRAPDGPPARDLARTLMLMNAAVLDGDARDVATRGSGGDTVAALTHVWLGAVWGIGPSVGRS
jgi:AcrR family transcriptional regulator